MYYSIYVYFSIIHVTFQNYSCRSWEASCYFDTNQFEQGVELLFVGLWEHAQVPLSVVECVVGGWRFEGVGVGQCWVVVAIAGEDLTASGCVKLLNNCMICMRSSNCLSDRTCHICGAILRRNGMISSSLSSDSMCFNSCCSNASTVIAVFWSGLARLRAHCREPSKKTVLFL